MLSKCVQGAREEPSEAFTSISVYVSISFLIRTCSAYPRVYSFPFCHRLMCIIPAMINSAKEYCRQQNLPDRANAKQMFRDLDFDDLFEDAGMVDLIFYLRGNRHLKIPEEWRPYLPTQLQKHTFKRPLKNIQKTWPYSPC